MKKADVAEHPKVFRHIGLLIDEPLGLAEVPFIESSELQHQVYSAKQRSQARLLLFDEDAPWMVAQQGARIGTQMSGNAHFRTRDRFDARCLTSDRCGRGAALISQSPNVLTEPPCRNGADGLTNGIERVGYSWQESQPDGSKQ